MRCRQAPKSSAPAGLITPSPEFLAPWSDSAEWKSNFLAVHSKTGQGRLPICSLVNMIGHLLPRTAPETGRFPPCRTQPMSEDRMMLVAAAVFVTASALLALSL